MTTTDDAMTAALAISDLILKSNSIPEGESLDSGDLIFDDTRAEYGDLRALLMPRLGEFDAADPARQLISNLLDIADDHFDF